MVIGVVGRQGFALSQTPVQCEGAHLCKKIMFDGKLFTILLKAQARQTFVLLIKKIGMLSAGRGLCFTRNRSPFDIQFTKQLIGIFM